MIAGAGKDADTLLEEHGSSGSKIGQRIRRRIPKRQKGCRVDGLAKAHHGFAVRKGEDFNGTAEDRARERS